MLLKVFICLCNLVLHYREYGVNAPSFWTPEGPWPALNNAEDTCSNRQPPHLIY